MKIIELQDEEAAALTAKATAAGLTLEAWLKKLASTEGNQPVETSADTPPPRRRHISEIIRENMSRVPPEIMATMPKDGASEHDHYIYGLPKRNP